MIEDPKAIRLIRESESSLLAEILRLTLTRIPLPGGRDGLCMGGHNTHCNGKFRSVLRIDTTTDGFTSCVGDGAIVMLAPPIGDSLAELKISGWREASLEEADRFVRGE